MDTLHSGVEAPSQKTTEHEFDLLEAIEVDPDVTQASLSVRLGISVGMINWYIKRLIAKGYVKVKRAQRRKLRYIITPEGLAFRARLTINYLENSLQLYRRTRQRVRDLLAQVRQAGFERVLIEDGGNNSGGNVSGGTNSAGDIVDICRLTCLEQGVTVEIKAAETIPSDDLKLPVLEVRGTKVFLRMGD